MANDDGLPDFSKFGVALDTGLPTIGQVPRAPMSAGEAPATAMSSGANDVDSILDRVSADHGVDRKLLEAFASIESSKDPSKKTGPHKGLFMLSDDEFKRFGGQGDIFNPEANSRAAALKIKAETASFERKNGRPPTAAEIYLIHQQGEGGADAHWRNPDLPAWQSMASTAEGRQKGDLWAKQAIWGNLTPDARRQFKDVNNVTSRDFVDFWNRKVDGHLEKFSGRMSLGGPKAEAAPDFSGFGTPVDAKSVAPPRAAATSSSDFSQGGVPVADTKSATKGGDGNEFVKGFTGGLLYGNPKNLGEAMEGFGHILDVDALRSSGGDLAKWGDKKLKDGYEARVPSIANIRTDSVGNFFSDSLSFAGYGVGQGLSSSLPSLATGMLGTLATANPIVGVVIGAAAPSYIQNYGDVYGSAKEDKGIAKRIEKGELTQKQLANTTAIAAVPMAALDVAGLGTVLGKTVFAEAKDNLKKRIVNGIVTGAITEGPTEGLQEIVSQWAQHYLGSDTEAYEKFIKVMDNFLVGSMTGGVMGGGTSVLKGRGKAPPKTGDEPPAAPVPPAPPIPGQPGTFADTGAVVPPPASPAPAAPEAAAILQRAGYSPDDIAAMSPAEIAAEVASAQGQGVAAPAVTDSPTAEPIKDLVAQAKDLVDPKNDRKAVYLSPDNVANLKAQPAFVDQLAKALSGNAEVLENVDGKGGALIVADDATKATVEKAQRAGRNMESVIGGLTGSGTGKKPNADTVVQQTTKDGAVTRETAVPASEAKAAADAMASPGRKVRQMAPEDVLDRRNQQIAEEMGIAKAEQEAMAVPSVGDGSRRAPVKVEIPEDIDTAGQRVAPEPTDAQKEAGNYTKGHIKLHGLDISIENAKGSTRRGTGPDGTAWEVRMPAAYGYVKRTLGRDGDQVDVYVGDDPASDKVFVVDQVDTKTGKFDEHKALIGFPSRQAALDTYEAAFSDGRGAERAGGVTELTVDEFKDWLGKGKRTRPLSPLKATSGPERYQGDPLSAGQIDGIVDAWAYVRDVLNLDKPQSLAAWIIARGGLRDDAREVRHIAGAAKERPGLVNRNGLTLDDAAMAAWEAGYMWDMAERPTVSEFLDALQDDLHSGEVVQRADQEYFEAVRHASDMAEELADYGVTTSRFRTEGSLRQYFGQKGSADSRPSARDQAAEPATSRGQEPAPEAVVEPDSVSGKPSETPRETADTKADTGAPETGPSAFSQEEIDQIVAAWNDLKRVDAMVEDGKEVSDAEVDAANELNADFEDATGSNIDAFETESALRDFLGRPDEGAERIPEEDRSEQNRDAEGPVRASGREAAAEPARAREDGETEGAVVEGLRPGDVLPEPDVEPSTAEKTAPVDRGKDRLKDYSGIIIDGYVGQEVGSERDGSLKRGFLADARDYLTKASKELEKRGFAPFPDKKGKKEKPGRAVRVDPAGPAVSGDVSLNMVDKDDNGIYAMVSGAIASPNGGVSLMARRARAGDQYGTSSQNQWLSVDLTVPELVDRLERIARPGSAKPAPYEIAKDPKAFEAYVKDGQTSLVPEATTKEKIAAEAKAKADRGKARADSDAGELFNPDAGKQTDLVDMAKAPADPYLAGKDVAREHVLTRGRAENLEFGMMVLPDGSTKENRATKNNTRSFLEVTEETAPELYNGEPKTVDFHHNHPKSTSLSRSDYTHAAPRRALRRTWVHGHDGSEYWASLNGDAETLGKAFDIAKDATDALKVRRAVAPDVHRRYAGHLRALMMREAGIIDYGATLAPENAGEPIAVLRKAIGKKWKAAVSAIRELGDENGLYDRRPGDQRADRGVAQAPGEPAVARPGTAGSAVVDGERTQDDRATRGGERDADGRGRDGGLSRDPLVALGDKILDEGFKTIVEARKFAREIGIEGDNKAIDEAIETAVVGTASRLAQNQATPPASVFRMLVNLYDNQPNLASRTGTSVANQAYSTPVPLAYVASRLAGVAASDSVYEPTAGNGALLLEVVAKGKAIVNELDPRRAASLRAQGFTVTENDGAIPPKAKDVDSVIMNPPFGAVKVGGKTKSFDVDEWRTKSIDHAVALNGLKAMADDGKAVLILGGSKAVDVAERRKDYRGKAKREFYYRLYNEYKVTDHFTVSGDLYSKQGASWPVDVIVIEGRGKSERTLPAAEPPAILNSWDEVGAKLDGRSDTKETRAARSKADRPSEGGAATVRDDAGAGKPAPGGRSDPVLPKEGGDAGAVRAERDRGKSGDVRADVEPAATEPRGDRDGGRARQQADAQPARRVKRERQEGASQAPYEPVSQADSLDTLIPVNMADAARGAMERISEKHGTVDALVADRLGYDQKDLSKYFSAEQVDALAAAIDNVERGSAMIIGDQTGIGKGRSQPFDAKLLTPAGWVDMGAIRVGDHVCSVAGTATKVVAIFPQGEIDVYRIEFSDGASTEASADHLWATKTRNQRHYSKTNASSIYSQFKIRTTIELADPAVLRQIHSIPLVDPVQFPERDLPIDPYFVGVCLGDGCLRERAVQVVIADEEMHGLVTAALPAGVMLRKVPSRDYHYDVTKVSGRAKSNGSQKNPALEGLRSLGLRRIGSINKYVPNAIKFNSIGARLAVLQGLMDTDGECSKDGASVFNSTSSLLADDVVFIVRSLGGTATRSIKKTTHNPCHRVYVRLPAGINPFRLSKKADRVRSEWVKYPPTRYVKSVTLVGKKHCQCISIDHPSRLYVTDDFIVTHNTAAGMLRYAMKNGMIPVFVTEKPDLYGDMYRDLRDVGVPEMLGREPRMFITNAGETITLDEEALTWKQESEEAKARGESPPKRRGKFLVGGTAAKVNDQMVRIHQGEDVTDVVFTTYDQMNTVQGKSTPRRTFLERVAPRAMVVFDESHNAGGAAKTGWEKKDAPENRADFARKIAATAKGVMFSSATYAKRPDVMDLYARTDMGKAVDDPKDLPDLIQRGGVPMQQIVASMLAQSGQYMRRERSFDGIEYKLQEVAVDRTAYRQFSSAMQAIFRFDLAVEEFRGKWGQDALDQRGMAKARDSGVGAGSASSIGFAALMHNIVNQMLLAIKANASADEAIAAHKRGEKPVIALANTNESFIKDFAEQEGIKIGDAIDLNFSAVLERYLARTLRVTIKHPDGKTKEHLQIPVKDLSPGLRQAYAEAKAFVTGGDFDGLPISPIDWIRHRLGQAGLSVKEVTGRQTMLDYSDSSGKSVGGARYIARPKSEQGASGKRLSIAAFNSGRLDALILNRSGSTGVSMHASKTFKDQRRRRMILAQAEGNIDTHLQMLGRVHRTGQVVTPSYSQIAADIPAESRPTAVLMKKMASLNANTTGARSSAFTVENADFMNEVGDKIVVEALIEDADLNSKMGDVVEFDENGKPKVEDAARKATGRLTVLDVEAQEAFLDRVQKAYIAEIAQLDAMGENPLEAKTVDIKAKTLESTDLKPKQGDSPFLDAVRIEKVSAKADGRALPPAEVATKIAEALKIEKPSGEVASSLAALEARGRAWKDGEVRRVGDLIRDQIREEVAAVKAEAKDNTRRRAEAHLSRWLATMNLAYPGARVTLGMPAGDLDGIVMGVERTGKAKQMGALGSWTIRIAVPDSMRQIEFPMSKLFPDGFQKAEDEKGATIGRSGTSHGDMVAKFEEARKEGRETRYIVTGNILGGYDQTQGKGRIVNFTTEDGQIRPGILMGREFALDKFMPTRRVKLTSADQVVAFLDKVSDGEVKGADADLVITKGYNGYRIVMSAARGKAGKYFTDANVRSALGGADFQKRGNLMIADRLTRAQAMAAISEMQKIGAVLGTDTAQDVAQSLPLMAIGGPSFEAAQTAVLAGKAYSVSPVHVAEQIQAIRPLVRMVPENAFVGVLERIEPFGEASIDPRNQKARAVYRLAGGGTKALVLPLSRLDGIRAFAVRSSALGGRPALFLNNLLAPERLAPAAAGQVWHEGIHVLWREGLIPSDVRARLVRHANSLGVLDLPLRDVLEAVGDPNPDEVGKFSVRDGYKKLYQNTPDLVDRMRQESIAHMLELWHHGYFSDADVAPIRDIIDDIGSGRLAGNPVVDVGVGADSGYFAAVDSSIGRSMRRDLDALGFYSKALEAARALKQARGTPEQMLAQIKSAGVKDSEIEATGLRAALDGKKSVTRDEIVGHLEQSRVDLKQASYARTAKPDTSNVAMEAWIADYRRRNPGATDDDGFMAWRDANRAMDETKWSNYSLDPSNPTYRETVLHLPENKIDPAEVARKKAKILEADAAIGRLYERHDNDEAAVLRDPEYAPLARIMEEQTINGVSADAKSFDFRSGHFPEPNIVGHMMTSMTRHEGKPVFTLDQIQSDWGQKLRDGGVRDEAKIAELKAKMKDVAAKHSPALAAWNEFALRLREGRDPVDWLPTMSDGDMSSGMRKAENWFASNRITLTQEQRAEFQRLFLGLEYGRREIMMVSAELRTAEAAPSGNPLVNTTDQWTQTTLRRAIRQAVEAGAEYIAIPHGDTVLSYNPGDQNGMRRFYGSRTSEGIVPKNLRKLLGAIDKAAAAPVLVEKLATPSGPRGWKDIADGGLHIIGELGQPFDKSQTGFTLFPLTESVKRSVMEEGQPMFSLGAGDNAAAAGLRFTPAAEKAKAALAREMADAINIVARMTGQDAVRVEFPETISIDGARQSDIDAARAIGMSLTPRGRYVQRTIDGGALIQLAVGVPGRDLATTAGHEAYHHVESVLATPQEMKLLRSPAEMERARRLVAAEIGRSADEVSALPDYEIRAIAFQRYRRLREEGAEVSGLHIGIRKLYDRIMRVIRGVQNVLRGNGFDSMEAVFERARTGQMASRQALSAPALRVGEEVADQSGAEPAPMPEPQRDGNAKSGTDQNDSQAVVDQSRSPEDAARFLDRIAGTKEFRPGILDYDPLNKKIRPFGYSNKAPFRVNDIDPKNIRSLGVQSIPLSRIRTEQPVVSLGGVKAKIASPGKSLPQVIKHGDDYWISEGNHRITAAWALGQDSVRVAVGEIRNPRAPSGTEAFRSAMKGADDIDAIGPNDPHPGKVLAFHGTDRDLDGGKFDVDYSSDFGIHFGTRGQANERAAIQDRDAPNRIYPVVLDLKSVIDMPDLWSWQALDVAREAERRVPSLAGLSRRIAEKADTYDDPVSASDELLRSELTAAGIDGIRYRNETEGEGWSYVVWETGKATSATSPETAMMSFFPTATSPGTATGRKVARITRQMGSALQPRSDAIRRKIQDRFLPQKRQEQAIERVTGVALPESLRVYDVESLMPKRAAAKELDLDRDHVQPLIEVIRQNSLAYKDLSDYLIAMHASERNAYIRSIDPSNDMGSGITDAEAQAIIKKIQASGKQAAYDDAANRARAIARQSLDLQLASGLIGRERYDALVNAWTHYVPLRGFEITADEDETFARTGRGLDVRGPESYRAMGRRSKSDDPMAYILLQAKETIRRSEKNRVNKTLMRLVQAHPDPDVWEVFKGEYRRRVVDDPTMPGGKRVETYFVPPPFSAKDEDIVGVKIGGKQQYIRLNDPLLAKAFKGMDRSDFDTALMRTLGTVARTYARLLTSLNPEFVLSNFVRDAQTAMINSRGISHLSSADRRKIARDTLSWKSIRGVAKSLGVLSQDKAAGVRASIDRDYQSLRTSGFGNHVQILSELEKTYGYAAWYEDFRKAGGQTGFLDSVDIPRLKRKVESALTEGSAMRTAKAALQAVENLNTAVENAARLAVYVALRKNGVSEQSAATEAAELTVNFNRRGEFGPIINSLYLFFNASIQGTMTMAHAIAKSSKVRKAVGALVVLGVTLDILNYMMAGDDDDKENAYDKIKGWVKDRNLIVMLPGRTDRIMIPLPYGFNLPYVMGQKVGEAIRTQAGLGGNLTPAKAVAGIAKAWIDAFNPIAQSETSFLQALAPTLIDPIAQVSENKNWFGGPIYPKKYDEKKPDSENYFQSVHPVFKEVARWLNSATGGNPARSGAIDVSPEVLEHYGEFLAGGVGKFLLNVVGTGKRLLDGDEVIPHKTPFVRRFYGADGADIKRMAFREQWHVVEAANYEVTQLSKAGNTSGANSARKEWAAELRAYGPMHSASRTLSALGKQKTQVELNKSMSDADKKERLKSIQEQESRAISRALEAYARAKKQEKASSQVLRFGSGFDDDAQGLGEMRREKVIDGLIPFAGMSRTSIADALSSRQSINLVDMRNASEADLEQADRDADVAYDDAMRRKK